MLHAATKLVYANGIDGPAAAPALSDEEQLTSGEPNQEESERAESGTVAVTVLVWVRLGTPAMPSQMRRKSLGPSRDY